MKFKDITEAPKTAVLAFGRMNPPTIGHKKLADKVASLPGDPFIFVSQSQKPKTDPLNFPDKLKYAKASFPNVTVGSSDVKTIIQALQKIESIGYDNIIYVAGSDRIQDFTTLINKYNGKEYNFNKIDVVSAGERDPDAEGAEGMSASKMRAAAAAGDFDSFKQGVANPKIAQQMFTDVRKGMGITEILGFATRTPKRTSIKKKPEKFEPSVQDRIAARRKAAAKGDKDAWKSKKKVDEGYKLQLERDTDMMVLHIVDTETGRRTEVRGKLGYESGNYDPNDKLHMLLDKIGKSADISQLMNGEPVGINPKHPQGASAKAATDKAYNESDVPLGKYLFHVTYASGLTGMLRDGHLGEPDEYFSMTADPKYVVSGNPEVQIVIDTARVSKMETFEKHVEDWESTPGAGDWAKGDDGDFESEYRVEETIPWNYVVAVKILKSKATPEIIKLAKKRGVKLVGKDNNVTENVAYNESTDLNSLRKFVRSQREAPDQVLYQMMMAPDTYGHSASNFVRSWYEKTKEENGLNDVDSALEIMVDQLGLNENFNEGITTIDLKNALEKISKNATNGERLVDVFIMRYQHNMTFKQIGDEIGTSIDRARQVYLRAERMIRKSLQDYDPKVKENFADGKKKGKSRPGRVKRSGASCNGSVTSLRKKAKAGGEKGRMYHWCANMKSGRKKK